MLQENFTDPRQLGQSRKKMKYSHCLGYNTQSIHTTILVHVKRAGSTDTTSPLATFLPVPPYFPSTAGQGNRCSARAWLTSPSVISSFDFESSPPTHESHDNANLWQNTTPDPFAFLCQPELLPRTWRGVGKWVPGEATQTAGGTKGGTQVLTAQALPLHCRVPLARLPPWRPVPISVSQGSLPSSVS